MSSSIAKSIEREEKLEKEGLNKAEDRRPDPDSLADAYKGTINAGTTLFVCAGLDYTAKAASLRTSNLAEP